jgi:hypothetical protein
MLQKTFDELWESISEVEIEKWISLVNAERKCSGITNSTEPELKLESSTNHGKRCRRT